MQTFQDNNKIISIGHMTDGWTDGQKSHINIARQCANAR